MYINWIINSEWLYLGSITSRISHHTTGSIFTWKSLEVKEDKCLGYHYYPKYLYGTIWKHSQLSKPLRGFSGPTKQLLHYMQNSIYLLTTPHRDFWGPMIHNRTKQLQRRQQQQQLFLGIPTRRRQISWLFTRTSATGKLNQGLPGSNSIRVVLETRLSGSPGKPLRQVPYPLSHNALQVINNKLNNF